jgi:dihydrofolate reductase
MINIIVACDRNNLIGKNGKLPWDIKEDWEYFLEQTANGILIMGRHCYLDFEEHAKRRSVIVLSRNPEIIFPHANKASSLEDALEQARRLGKTAWICGGREIYREAMAIADQLYLTQIDAEYEGNVYLPSWEPFFSKEISSTTQQTDSGNLCFRILSK